MTSGRSMMRLHLRFQKERGRFWISSGVMPFSRSSLRRSCSSMPCKVNSAMLSLQANTAAQLKADKHYKLRDNNTGVTQSIRCKCQVSNMTSQNADALDCKSARLKVATCPETCGRCDLKEVTFWQMCLGSLQVLKPDEH